MKQKFFSILNKSEIDTSLLSFLVFLSFLSIGLIWMISVSEAPKLKYNNREVSDSKSYPLEFPPFDCEEGAPCSKGTYTIVLEDFSGFSPEVEFPFELDFIVDTDVTDKIKIEKRQFIRWDSSQSKIFIDWHKDEPLGHPWCAPDRDRIFMMKFVLKSVEKVLYLEIPEYATKWCNA